MLRTIKSFFNKLVTFVYITYRYATIVFFIIFSIACSSCSGNKTQQAPVAVVTKDTSIIELPDPSPVSAKERARIYAASDEWYRRMLAASHFNGGMIVAKKGNIIFEMYNGTAHIPGKDTISAVTPMHVASISKTFTAMGVLKLWQDGKLNLDDPFSKYFPQFNYPGVTVRTLLNHRSGLPNYLYFMEDLGWDKTKFIRNEDVLNTLINRKGELKNIGNPNTHFEYCNTNFALLGLLIEKVSGEKLPDFLKDTFFGPLHMDNTFVYTDADSAKATPSYDWRNKRYPFGDLDKVYGDKNVFTTPRDLLTWDRALTSGKIFKPETLEQAYKPYSNERAGVKNYGLGWHMYLFPGGRKIIYHNGWWHGSNAVFTRLLQDSATVIVIGNKFNHNIYKAKDLSNIFGNYDGNGDDEGDDLNPPATSTPAPPPAATKPHKAVVRHAKKAAAHPVKKVVKKKKKR